MSVTRGPDYARALSNKLTQSKDDGAKKQAPAHAIINETGGVHASCRLGSFAQAGMGRGSRLGFRVDDFAVKVDWKRMTGEGPESQRRRTMDGVAATDPAFGRPWKGWRLARSFQQLPIC